MAGQTTTDTLERPQPAAKPEVGPPLGMLAELTHRCPLQCVYCSNPVRLLKGDREMSTAQWLDVLSQAADLGILQIHLSGGEPTLRQDLEDMVELLAKRGVYTNLVTAGVTFDRDRLFRLRDKGLDHVQLSIQSIHADLSNKISNYKDGLARKLRTAAWVTEAGLPLTINAPIHRQNIRDAAKLIDLALELGADRLEVANTQYYGWAELNRAALLPDYQDVLAESAVVEAAKLRLKGILNIDYVPSDYYAEFPKPCMGGWAKDVLNVTPEGKVLPCHAAESMTNLKFDSATEKPLADIWYNSHTFNIYRGDDWMKEPCRSCDRKDIDHGGCRCQAFALTGDAANADPACIRSPHHKSMLRLATHVSAAEAPPFIYRRIGYSPE